MWLWRLKKKKKKVDNSQIRQLLASPRPYSADEDWEQRISGSVRTSAFWSPPCAPSVCIQCFLCIGRAPSICIFASIVTMTLNSCHTVIFKVPMWTMAHVMSSSCWYLTTCWQIGARSAVLRELGPISVGSTLACQWNSITCPQSPGECHLSV